MNSESRCNQNSVIEVESLFSPMKSIEGKSETLKDLEIAENFRS